VSPQPPLSADAEEELREMVQRLAERRLANLHEWQAGRDESLPLGTWNDHMERMFTLARSHDSISRARA
jgi:hypothetical protein